MQVIGGRPFIATENGVHNEWNLSNHRLRIQSRGDVNSSKELAGVLTLVKVTGQRDSGGCAAGPRVSG